MDFKERPPPLPPPMEELKPPPSPPPPKPSPKKVVIRGLLRIIILSQIRRKPTYGAEIHRTIREKYGLDVHRAEIYMLLRKMEAEGLIVSSWDFKEKDVVKRRYVITEEGIDHLNTTIKELEKIKDIIDIILKVK